MKIALVAPSAVPYVVGGAEKLWWGLLEAFRRYSNHEIELIKIPSPERDFAEVIGSYQRFSELNLNHFDRVISTKYPAWMVNHNNHYVYLQHTLRGLYDTYPPDMALALAEWPAELEPLARCLNLHPRPEHRPRMFAELRTLMNSEHGAAYFQLPSPLARQVLHWLDRTALQPGQIKKFMAISANVAQRADYFPEGASVQIIHHPSDLSPSYQSSASSARRRAYLFTVSRLARPKRLDLLIRAMQGVAANIQLLIAGSGPDEARLRLIAGEDKRVVFLGRVSDEQVRKLYAGALAVAFVPKDEDYGLVTVEALQAGKPVITCADSGGVTELIEADVTGWVVPAQPLLLAQRISQLAQQPELAVAMEAACLARGRQIHWQGTLAAILDSECVLDNDGFLQRGKPQKIVVAVSFPIHPAMTGGQNRIFHLYRYIAYFTPVTLVTLCSHNEPAMTQRIAPGLTEIRIPKSAAHERGERALEAQLKVSVGDVYALAHIDQTPEYLQALKQACLDADLVVASHPYLYPAIKAVYRGRVFHESHNVEADMKASLFGEEAGAPAWLERVRAVEYECLHATVGTAVCSQADRQRMQALYGESDQNLAVVPNGTVINKIASEIGADRIKARVKPGGPVSALFIGSWHGPNIEAAQFIVGKLAKLRPDIEFWLVGGVCRAIDAATLPANVRLWGQIEESEKWVLLRTADIALNPVVSGAGSNLKMAEYAAAGVPILSTLHGCRGLALKPEKHVHIAEIDNFSKKLKTLVNLLGSSALEQVSAEACAVSVGGHNWRGIASSYYRQIVSICSK